MQQQESGMFLYAHTNVLHKQVANYEKDTRKDITLHVTHYIRLFTMHRKMLRFGGGYGPFSYVLV